MRQYGRRKAGALAPEIPSLVFRISNIGEEVQFLEGFPGTFRNGAQRVFRNVDGQACLFVQELVQPAQQGDLRPDQVAMRCPGGFFCTCGPLEPMRGLRNGPLTTGMPWPEC